MLTMIPTPRIINTPNAVIPIMAALPYEIDSNAPDPIDTIKYDPINQLMIYAGGRNYSTCRYDESVGGIFSKSRSDTQKDD
jgi:hypothetical protein